ncbi:ABC transporter ATP-binding protein [Bradyrhizobium sp. USDA 336]|uniref:ABC transporter ATP-binding protein n=1 Tax=Bradyrhizobium sp. USDA 336 TaxID=3156311 RepID=UPI003832CD97
MSSNLAIAAKGLSKAYLIYSQPTDRLLQGVVPRLQRYVRPVARCFGAELGEKTYFSRHWALQELDFKVARGETVGVIGRNGSGKSTLLQLVCGTLTPTAGDVQVKGRVAALLELGSGFNPEYTGRENVILNASVLGLSQEETRARMDDIVAFADIGGFVDQPVKTYSSGMAMRLAFAVIAHVDADILIIDEALAVGDAYFQQKCLRWLRQFRETGTVLFCGHDTGAVMSLCQRALWLDKGRLQMEGTAKDVCEAYAAAIQAQAMGLPENVVRLARPRPRKVAASQNQTSDKGAGSLAMPPAKEGEAARRPRPPAPQAEPPIFDVREESSSFGSGLAEIVETTMTAPDGTPLSWIEGGEAIAITIRIKIAADMESPIVGFHVKDRLGQPLFGDNTFLSYADQGLVFRQGQQVAARFVFVLPNLASGRYSVTTAIASGTLDVHVQHHWQHDALLFDVHSRHRNGVMVAIPMQEMELKIIETNLRD